MDTERDILDLYSTDYEPVWAAGVEFPGVIPESISEHLYEGIERFTLFIGPVSSLFWLAGVEELSELIGDPAYVLTDEYRSIPQGAPCRWIVQILYEEGKIPTTIMAKVCGENVQKQTFTITRPSSIPSNVTSTPTQKSILEVFPFARQQSFPPTVSCAKTTLKGKKNTNSNCVDLMNNFINSLGGNLLFKGLSRRAVASLAAFFTPLTSSNTFDHEFGPGFYTTPSAEYALEYAGLDGAILIFKDVDFRPLVKVDLAAQDWQATVDFWTGTTFSKGWERVPATWDRSDILEGPISSTDLHSRRRVPGSESQVVGVSHAGLEAFASALHMVIWLERPH